MGYDLLVIHIIRINTLKILNWDFVGNPNNSTFLGQCFRAPIKHTHTHHM